MKKKIILAAALLACIICNPCSSHAQTALSFDAAAVRNLHKQLNGINMSSFYHFNEHLSGGVELNRFFTATTTEDGEKMNMSAWDFDLNFHYQFPLVHHLYFYPVTGISHTSEKEAIQDEDGEATIERFWSYNTGAGILWHKGKWAPHAEYLFTWGQVNQQFFLAGISYEMELSHKHRPHTVKE